MQAVEKKTHKVDLESLLQPLPIMQHFLLGPGMESSLGLKLLACCLPPGLHLAVFYYLGPQLVLLWPLG